LQNPDTWINLALSVRLAERCPASGNTMKDQTIRKRLEAAFIEADAVQAGDGSSRWRGLDF
jgi:hypothetical protein